MRPLRMLAHELLPHGKPGLLRPIGDWLVSPAGLVAFLFLAGVDTTDEGVRGGGGG